MSFGRLCIAAALFFAATYIHVFVPLWAQAAREPMYEILDAQGFSVFSETEDVMDVLWFVSDE